MEALKNLQPLREFCRENPWPRITQWNHWIATRHDIALKTVKKIGGRYVLDLEAFQEIVRSATLDDK